MAWWQQGTAGCCRIVGSFMHHMLACKIRVLMNPRRFIMYAEKRAPEVAAVAVDRAIPLLRIDVLEALRFFSALHMSP